MSGEAAPLVVAVLTGHEASDAFLLPLLGEAVRVWAVLVVDPAGGPGFAPGEIARGRETLKQVCRKARSHRVLCQDLLEWGSALHALSNAAARHGALRVALVRENRPEFAALVGGLKKRGLAVHALPAPA